jgi:hypothetical protein
VLDTTLVPEKFQGLQSDLGESQFLFQDEKIAVIDATVEKANELMAVSQTMKGDPPQDPNFKKYSQQKLITMDGEGRNWAWHELQRAEERFRKYLHAG